MQRPSTKLGTVGGSQQGDSLSAWPLPLAGDINSLYTMSMRPMAKRFLLLFFVLWLPTQSYAAIAMPACVSGGRAATATHACEHAGSEHQTADSAGAACDDCAVCHSSGLFFFSVMNPPSSFNVVRESRPASRFFSIFLARFQRPPLAS